MTESSSEEPRPFPSATAAFIQDGMVYSEAGVAPLEGISLAGPVMLGDREGVFAHSWKCLGCRLEFVPFSWLRTRHTLGAIYCPECGRQTPMLHCRATLSTAPTMVFDDGRLGESLEIFDVMPLGDADMLNDSVLPG